MLQVIFSWDAGQPSREVVGAWPPLRWSQACLWEEAGPGAEGIRETPVSHGLPSAGKHQSPPASDEEGRDFPSGQGPHLPRARIPDTRVKCPWGLGRRRSSSPFCPPRQAESTVTHLSGGVSQVPGGPPGSRVPQLGSSSSEARGGSQLPPSFPSSHGPQGGPPVGASALLCAPAREKFPEPHSHLCTESFLPPPTLSTFLVPVSSIHPPPQRNLRGSPSPFWELK